MHHIHAVQELPALDTILAKQAGSDAFCLFLHGLVLIDRYLLAISSGIKETHIEFAVHMRPHLPCLLPLPCSGLLSPAFGPSLHSGSTREYKQACDNSSRQQSEHRDLLPLRTHPSDIPSIAMASRQGHVEPAQHATVAPHLMLITTKIPEQAGRSWCSCEQPLPLT